MVKQEVSQEWKILKKFADYFNGKTISVGYKNSGLSGTDFTTKQLNKDLKDLTVKFDSAKQGAIELDTGLGRNV